jgi:5-methylcytosine-specific restriction endonuclease McrA
MGTLKNIRKKKMIAQGGRCYYCDLPMWDDTHSTFSRKHCRITVLLKALRCTAEHLHPRSEGGVDTTGNIVAACVYCNNQRHRRKRPLSPEAHRQRVQQRMAAGKWLAARFASWSSST